MFETIDPYMRNIETLMKLPEGVTSRQLVPEILSRIVEIPIDIVANDIIGAKIMKGVLGFFFALAPQQIGPMITRDWKPRDSEDTYAMAKMWLLEATDPTADDLVKIANAINNLRMGFAFGDMNRIANVFGTKPLSAITNEWQNVVKAFGAAFGVPGAKAPAKSAAEALAPLYHETLSGPGAARAEPAGPSQQTKIPGVFEMFRSTSDHQQPTTSGVTPRFKVTIG